MTIFKKLFLSGVLLLTIGCQTPPPQGETPITPVVTPENPLFVRGIDLSFAPEIALSNTQYYQAGQTLPLLDILKNAGINTIRLRLWHTPSNGHCGLNEVLNYAKIVQMKGLKVWLDIHYSDTWADPGTQTKPLAWRNAVGKVLEDSVYNYTYWVVSTFKQQGVEPSIIQVGNETNSGFLWTDGKVGGAFDNNWSKYAALVKRAVKAIRLSAPKSKIMLHYADPNAADWFFQHLKQENVVYDIIGLSYYPFWHGTSLAQAQVSMQNLAISYQKPVVIAETAYPFTMGWNDWTNNIVGSSAPLVANMPASPEGQRLFIAELKQALRTIGISKAQGLCYWAGDYVAFRGAQATNGSPWENLALFDFQNNSLPALIELGKE